VGLIFYSDKQSCIDLIFLGRFLRLAHFGQTNMAKTKEDFMKVAPILFSVFTFAISHSVQAENLFVIKKTLNPKNELHYSAVSKDCKLLNPSVRTFWVMGEEGGQLEDLTATERPFFQPRISYAADSESDFSFGAMDKMGNRLPDKTIKVRLENCQARAYVEIQDQEIQLKEISVKMNMVLNVKSMTITGVAPDGATISQTFEN
jgi:hypothetical protein